MMNMNTVCTIKTIRVRFSRTKLFNSSSSWVPPLSLKRVHTSYLMNPRSAAITPIGGHFGIFGVF